MNGSDLMADTLSYPTADLTLREFVWLLVLIEEFGADAIIEAIRALE